MSTVFGHTGGGGKSTAPPILNLGAVWRWVVNILPRPGKEPPTHGIGAWVGPTAGLEDFETQKNSCPCLDKNPWPSSSKSSSYNDHSETHKCTTWLGAAVKAMCWTSWPSFWCLHVWVLLHTSTGTWTYSIMLFSPFFSSCMSLNVTSLLQRCRTLLTNDRFTQPWLHTRTTAMSTATGHWLEQGAT